MANVIHAHATRLEDEGFGWLAGLSIVEIEHAEPSSWWFRLSKGGELSTHGGVWRLQSPERLVVASEDHGHAFGLPAPLDAPRAARTALHGAHVLEARVRAGAPDLELRLSNGLMLELLALSSGYECWQVCDPAGRCVVVSGSRAASCWQEAPWPAPPG